MDCGLLGRKLSHSYSPQIHSFLGDYSYKLLEVEPNKLQAFFEDFNYQGINVTIPYKKDVIPYCHQLSEVARKMGAVNTIVRRSDGTLIGHNTDYFGFLSMIKKTGLSPAGKKVLILGSGGASNTAKAVMDELGANTVVISRKGQNNYTNLHLHRDASVIVNATPVGMYPMNGESPVDLDQFPKLEGVLDMIYNPCRTKLIMEAQKRNLIAENGLWMLVAQAWESAQWFTGEEISYETIEAVHKHLSVQMQNIVLVGMPGCGKSTVGSLLAHATGRAFVDADLLIEKKAGCSIPEIFKNCGENAFRTLETQVLDLIGKESGLVIATGGGCVTRSENYPLLHQNGIIVWLQRDLDLLPSEGRPLSQTTNMQEMYRNRKPLYHRFADVTVNNANAPEQTVELIRRLL